MFGLIFYLLLFSPDQRLYTVHVVACVWCTLARTQDLSLSRWGLELSGWNWERTDMCSVQVYRAIQAVTLWHWSGQHGDTGRVTLVTSVTLWSQLEQWPGDNERVRWGSSWYHGREIGSQAASVSICIFTVRVSAHWLRAYCTHLWCDVDWSEKCRVACSKHAPPSSPYALIHPWNKINPNRAPGLDHGLLSGICTSVPHYFLCTDLAWPQSIMIYIGYVSNPHSTRNSFLT